MYVRNMVNILYQDVFLTIIILWVTLCQQVVRVLGDRYKGLMEENSIYGAPGVWWDYSWRGVGVFSDGDGIGMVDGGGRKRLCIYRSKCESSCLFSCQHSDSISDFLFSRVFCDGWVIISSFLWRQRRHFLMSCCRWVLILVFPR